MSALQLARVLAVLAVLAVVVLGATIGVAMAARPTPIMERAQNVHATFEPFIWTPRGPISVDQMIAAISAVETPGESCIRSGKHKGC